MLFTISSLTQDEAIVIDRINEMRKELRFAIYHTPRRWTGLLARITRARAIRGSNSIEGINVSQEDAIAV